MRLLPWKTKTMDVRLVVKAGGKRNRVLQLHSPEAYIGRSNGCAIRIPSAEVSRKHCRLRLEDGLVMVEDLASANGTFLNGEPVTEAQRVRPGDRLEVGPVAFVVEYELTPEALRRLAEDDAFEMVEEEESSPDVVPMVDEELDTCTAEKPGQPAEEDLPIPVVDEEPNEPLTFNEEAWKLPQAEELRDILSHLDEEAPSPPGKRPRKLGDRG
jgi:predicted component of type VI protein secretion system